MKLVMFEVDGRPRAGRLEGEAIVELGGSIKEILASGALERARQATGAKHARKAVKLLPLGLCHCGGQSIQLRLDYLRNRVDRFIELGVFGGHCLSE